MKLKSTVGYKEFSMRLSNTRAYSSPRISEKHHKPLRQNSSRIRVRHHYPSASPRTVLKVSLEAMNYSTRSFEGIAPQPLFGILVRL